LQGLSDNQVRAVAGLAMRRRPRLMLLMKLRTIAILGAMFTLVWAFQNTGDKWLGREFVSLGTSLIVAGGLGTLAVVVWNFVWVNTVLFRITKEEIALQNDETPSVVSK
jgi:hypothetical protein